jgi:hypothetical protein
LAGSIPLPVDLERKENWSAEPTEVDVWITELDEAGEMVAARELATTVVFAHDESSRVVEIPLQRSASGAFLVDVAAPRSFNAPQVTSAVSVTGLDVWRVVLGSGLVLIGLLGSAWSWWSRRRRWVLPAAFVVIGALVLAVAVADFQTVRPEEVRMEEVDISSSWAMER